MSPLSIWLKAFWHCARTMARVMFDLVELFRLATKSRSALMAENLCSGLGQMADGLRKSALRLAESARGGEAGYSDPMASPRVPLVLALEVQTSRKTRSA